VIFFACLFSSTVVKFYWFSHGQLFFDNRETEVVRMLKPEEWQKLIAALKEKVGRKVRLLVQLEVRDKELGNMGADGGPRVSGSEIEIKLLGVYGLGSQPLYIHGVDTDGKAKIFRNNSDAWVEEETGNPTHHDCTTLLRVDDIDISTWFANGTLLANEHAFIAKVKAAEPDNKYLAERILNGQPDYRPAGSSPRYYPSYCMFEDSKFVEKAIAYLDKIV